MIGAFHGFVKHAALPSPAPPALPRRYDIAGNVSSGFTGTLTLCYVEADRTASDPITNETMRLKKETGFLVETWFLV